MKLEIKFRVGQTLNMFVAIPTSTPPSYGNTCNYRSNNIIINNIAFISYRVRLQQEKHLGHGKTLKIKERKKTVITMNKKR
jgi:acetyltransferase-like isoleucine patch superfamily enzyme